MRLTMLVAAMLLSCSIAPGSDSQAAGEGAGPAIKFIHPHPNDVISDYPIPLEVEVHNFKLLPPVQYWERVEPKDAETGHIHYTLDDSPIYATSKTKIILGKPDKPLPIGKHYLRAELVNVNHNPLKNRVAAEVMIVCRRSDNSGTSVDAGGNFTDKQTQLQLQQIEFQIKQIEQQLQDLKNR